MQRVKKLVLTRKRNNFTKTSKMTSEFDKLGSYTGSYSENEFEKPCQDADDL